MKRSVDGPAGSRLARLGRVILPRRSTAKTQMASRRWDDWPSGETRFGFRLSGFRYRSMLMTALMPSPMSVPPGTEITRV